MSKDITSGDVARQKMADGVSKLAAAVKITLGPKGRNVALQKPYGAPSIVNDGVTIAREIVLSDPLESMGAELVKEVASKTNTAAGDGTTTATLLTDALVKEGLKNLAAGANPIGIRTGIQKAVQIVTDRLKEMAIKVAGNKATIEQVATISSQDAEVGKLIAEAIDVIKDGPITVEASSKVGITQEIKEGMQFDQGYLAPHFITDGERQEAVYQNVDVLIYDGRISNVAHLLPVLNALAGKQVLDLVIIAEDIEGDALPTLIVNKLKGSFRSLAIKAPGYGDRRKANLQDIAVLTGATVVSRETGHDLEKFEMEWLGKAARVISTKDHTTVVGAPEQKDAIAERVAELTKQKDEAKEDYEKETLAGRIAKLTGGVAVLKVGAASETELREKKLRIEDAINATRAAMEEGIVPGGGMALLACWVGLNIEDEDPDVQTGIRIVQAALKAPLRQIAENAGASPDVVEEKCFKSPVGTGYNAATGKYVDMVEAGIIDPVKVTRSALENAASVAATFLTMEAAVFDHPEDKKDDGHPRTA